MGSMGVSIIFIYEVNISVAILAMVNHTSVKLSNSQNLGSNSTMKVEEICISSDTTVLVEVSGNMSVCNIKNILYNILNNKITKTHQNKST